MTRKLAGGFLLGAVLLSCTRGPSAPERDTQFLIGGQPDPTTRGVVAVVGKRESCSGALIAPNLVLTAAHCVSAFAGGGATIQCGVTTFADPDAASSITVTWDDDLRDGAAATTRASVRAIRTPTSRAVCGSDVALLILATDVPDSAATPLIPVVDVLPAKDDLFSAIGYGITNASDTTGTTYGLRQRVGNLKVVCVGTDCATQGITANEWRSSAPVCAGDSGGPALDAQGHVIGVASRGDANCTATLYGTVPPWRDFIVATATEAAQTGGYAAPPWATDAAKDASASDGASARPDAGAAVDATSTQDGPPASPPDTVSRSDASDVDVSVDMRAPVDMQTPADIASVTDAAGSVTTDGASPAPATDSSGCAIANQAEPVRVPILFIVAIACLVTRRRRTS